MNEHVEDLLRNSRPASFHYDHNEGLFWRDYDSFTPETLPLTFGRLSAVEEVTELPNVPLAHTYKNPVMLPKLFDWLDTHFDDSVASDTVDVMRDVFVRMRPDMKSLTLTRDRGGFLGFDAMRPRREYPHIFLTTLGNCACLGVKVGGTLGQMAWADKLAEFEYHNIDTPEQKVSLLAGLGHLAHLASS